ncbi:MAG: formylglycine-generating enzyme family protein [Planctomycetes bacterium]|nr:formylglycine-generating enzyme family protein [Planctomycetota bacterium]
MSSLPHRAGWILVACTTLATWSLHMRPTLADEKAKPLPGVRFPFGEDEAKKFQDDFAQAAKLPKEISTGAGMKMALIPTGTFEMGANGSKYRVTLARPFYIGITEVTLGQYRQFKPGHRVEGADAEFNEDDRPAAAVSWDDARAFCEWLSNQEDEKKAGRVYALPTEAQWEWATRAGTATARYFGETDKEQAKYSWFNVTYTPNPKTETKTRGRQPVRKLLPNAWGLHDTLGNVWEWCADRRSDSATGETRDPVMRGGSWRSGAFHCTASAHDPGSPAMKGDNIGFRVVSTISKVQN